MRFNALHIGSHTCLVTHMRLRLSGWVLGRPFKPCSPWPSVPPPSEGGSMRWNINGVRFCVRYTTWPAGWYQAHLGGRHRTQTQDALAACTHTGAPLASTWLWVSKVKFPARLLIWDLLTTLNRCLKEHHWLVWLFSFNQFGLMFWEGQLISDLCQRKTFTFEVRLLLYHRSWTRLFIIDT